MPPDAVLTVRIEDVSFADNSAPVMAESRETFGTRQVPIPFMLKVPCGGLDKRARYSLRADISAAGQKRFGTDRDIAVLMPGAPDQYDLRWCQCWPRRRSPTRRRRTYWSRYSGTGRSACAGATACLSRNQFGRLH
jgi:Type III secretion system lipoprotein chaperone (YscW)